MVLMKLPDASAKWGMVVEWQGWRRYNEKGVIVFVNLISFMPIKKYALPGANFHEPQILNSIFSSHIPNLFKSIIIIISKVWFSLHWFTRNSQSCNHFFGHFLHQILSKLDDKCRKYNKISFFTLKYNVFHSTNFHETEAWATAFSKGLMYRIWWKSEEQFVRWYWVMEKLYGYGIYISQSFLLCKECLKSDLHTRIQVTLCLLIIFVGLSVKYIIFNFCCFV